MGQLKELKAGNAIKKPIYNHVNGTLDTPEEITPTQIVIVEGLHPMADPRVRELLDFSLYLDITDDVKFAWKIQRDMVERGHSLESIQQSIEARKPDFDAFVAPQRGDADVVIQVLPTDLVPDEKEGKILKVKFIQRDGKDNFDPAYLFDEVLSGAGKYLIEKIGRVEVVLAVALDELDLEDLALLLVGHEVRREDLD